MLRNYYSKCELMQLCSLSEYYRARSVDFFARYAELFYFSKEHSLLRVFAVSTQPSFYKSQPCWSLKCRLCWRREQITGALRYRTTCTFVHSSMVKGASLCASFNWITIVDRSCVCAADERILARYFLISGHKWAEKGRGTDASSSTSSISPGDGTKDSCHTPETVTSCERLAVAFLDERKKENQQASRERV